QHYSDTSSCQTAGLRLPETIARTNSNCVMRHGGMIITGGTDRQRRATRAFAGSAVLVIFLSGAAVAFERANQADYDLFAFCYGQQVGAANAIAEDHEHWLAAYPQPDAQTAQAIGTVRAHAVELSTLADSTAALFEDLDHPGYEMDPISPNAAYAEGYSFWEGYMAVPFDSRVALELTEEMMGMSADCWRTTFAIEAMNAANAASGKLVWPE